MSNIEYIQARNNLHHCIKDFKEILKDRPSKSFAVEFIEVLYDALGEQDAKFLIARMHLCDK